MAKYVVIEIQKSANGSIAVPPIYTEETFFAARSRFHTICATAAISEVPIHSVVLLNDIGQQMGLESFDHTNNA